jgi:hypothetical protein
MWRCEKMLPVTGCQFPVLRCFIEHRLEPEVGVDLISWISGLDSEIL